MVKRTIKESFTVALLTALLALTQDKKPMAQITEWNQYQWTQPNVELYQNAGDFYSAEGLILREDELLRRGPAWSGHVDLASGIQNIEGGFWNEDSNQFVFIGEDDAATPSDIVICYFTSVWTVPTVHVVSTATAGLGGKNMQNVQYWGGDLWLIGANRHVYRGNNYTSGTLTDFDADGNAIILFPAGDRMYVVRDNGTVERLNDADNAFEAHYDPIASLDIVYATAFRGYILLAGRGDDGTLSLYRLPDRSNNAPTTLPTLSTLHGTGDYPTKGRLFTIHNDELYFSPGRIRTLGGSVTRYWIGIYRFTGSHIEFVTRLLNIPFNPETVGLLTWQDQLVYYALNQGDSDPQIKLMLGNAWIDFDPLSVDEENNYSPWIGTLNGHLVTSAHDDTNGEGVHYAGRGTLADGHIVTSRLHFDSPGREKRLEQITVILDGAATDFKIVVKYRVDDATSWTTATTGNNTRIVRATSIGASFYTLQIHIDLDDDSGGNKDIRIAAINAIITVPGQ